MDYREILLIDHCRLKELYFFVKLGKFFFYLLSSIKNVFMTIFVMGVVKINEFNPVLTIVNMSKS